VIRTAPRDGLSVRLCGLYDEVRAIIARHKPDVMAIEDVFYAKNVRTTIVLGHARGVILLAAQQSGMAISEYPPAEIKKSVVGAGAATKEQVQFMVARLLRLKSAPQPNDAADGVAAALAHLLTARAPRLERVR
jgi:crossover junction endodeoxyribonuclease RuvC